MPSRLVDRNASKGAGDFSRQSRTAVGDRDLNHRIVEQCGPYFQIISVLSHRVICVTQQIDQQLLHLDSVGAHVLRLRIEIELDFGAPLELRAYSAAWRKFPSSSEYTFTCRGGPIRTGWKNTAAPMVHSSDRAISSPMVEMPG
ncbi:MAG: hypothetical protein JWP51_2919 [Bradyrhizobium sp.]|nr:hypothetical protein [Bradyrhizobium sp.]